MKLHEEFKLYENMWDDESGTEPTELSDTISTALTNAFRHNDNILIEAPYSANAAGICEKWVSSTGRSLTKISVTATPEHELVSELKRAYSRKHIVLLEDVERLRPAVLSKLFATIVEDGRTAFTIGVVGKPLPFSSWNSRVFPLVVHGFTDFDESAAKPVLSESEFSSKEESDFKKGFISYVLKTYPDCKTACEILWKFDFRKATEGYALDVMHGVIEIPASVIDKKNYDWTNNFIVRELRQLQKAKADLDKLLSYLEGQLNKKISKEDTLITEAVGKTYTISCTSTDLDDAITLNKVPAYLKNVEEVELVDRDRVPVNKYNQICKMLADAGIKVTKGASGREPSSKLKESRSVADIEADIARLQQELEQAKIAEKKASYGGNLPKTVWTWDIYLEPSEKGTWTGIENDLVFETKDKALDAAWVLLNELDEEGELSGDPDDYYVEAFEVPLSSVSAPILKFNKLAHLI